MSNHISQFKDEISVHHQASIAAALHTSSPSSYVEIGSPVLKTGLKSREVLRARIQASQGLLKLDLVK